LIARPQTGSVRVAVSSANRVESTDQLMVEEKMGIRAKKKAKKAAPKRRPRKKTGAKKKAAKKK
jgi:rRNA processing protein Gar1